MFRINYSVLGFVQAFKDRASLLQDLCEYVETGKKHLHYLISRAFLKVAAQTVGFIARRRLSEPSISISSAIRAGGASRQNTKPDFRQQGELV